MTTGSVDTGEMLTGLPGRYTIERAIGRGGATILFLARERPPDRQVVVKVLDTRRCLGLERQRFLREVEIASQLRHPGIVPIFAAGQTACRSDAGEACLFYVMPYIPGESLRGRLIREGQLSITTTIAIARDIAGALDYAHRQGFVHRDVKPDNVLLDESHAFLTDFGIARTMSRDGITLEGRVVGTPPYMSPEQVEDETLGGATDVYSLACMMYEMLAGIVPFGGRHADRIMDSQLHQPPPSLVPLRPDLPPAVGRALQRALAKSAADRPATAGELVRDVAQAAGLAWMVEAPSTVTTTTLSRFARAARRRPLLTTIATATPALAAAGWLWLAAPSRTPGPTYADSVAVLIPRNLTGRPELDLLCQLAASGLRRHLARQRDLRVTSLQSAFAVRQSPLGLRQLAETLGVGDLLEGTMRLSADTVVFEYTLWDATERALLSGAERTPLARARSSTDAVTGRIAERVLEGLARGGEVGRGN